jgi:hypothetical protein
MDGFWPIFYLLVLLKIPVLGAMAIVWYAIRAEPREEESPESDDGGFRRRPRNPLRPRGPRRDPHAPAALPVPDCPPGGRFRVVTPPAPVRAERVHSHGRGDAEPTRTA